MITDEMKECPTWEAKLFLGLKDSETGDMFQVGAIRKYLRAWCDQYGGCFSIYHNEYIYTDGQEYGVVITLINYPRFSKQIEELEGILCSMAIELKDMAKQKRVSVMFPDTTITFGEDLNAS